MANAKYIIAQKNEFEIREKHIKSLPKLPMDVTLEKALPKALKIISKENCVKENVDKCNKDLIILVEPLLTNSSGEFVFLKDKIERERVKEALEFFVKIKAYKMLKEYNKTISQILKMNLFWVRDISTWEWTSRNTYKQTKSLIEHLFCKYEVPEFMFQVWTEKNLNNKHLEWFFQLASGESARNLLKFPIPITKRMAHEFINTPFPGYSIDDAIRRSQVLSMGGEPRLADAIMMSRLRHEFTNNDFWATVIQFFINTPMINLDEVGAIIDYINEKKYTQTRVVVDGIATYRPEMPGFTMKGRNVETLIRDTHEWHKELNRLRRQAGATGSYHYKPDLTSKWQRSLVKPFKFVEGKNEKQKIWNILEITNASDLYDEGKSMHHCVYSYLSSCISGKCSIFSLKLFGISMATIEVRDSRAVQIRGSHNKKPDDKEIAIINNWSKEENIEITKYAFGGR
jgi:hypothetical protein